MIAEPSRFNFGQCDHQFGARPPVLPATRLQSENSALMALARTMAESPQTILQKLVETALQLGRADTAGISLLEKHDGAEVFRWEALAGPYATRLNGTTPRDASPCGPPIGRNAPQLMYMAERFFPGLTAVPPVVEALLIPFHVEAKAVRTLWIVAHDEGRKFDHEAERIIKVLAQLASAGWHLWTSAQTEQRRVCSRRRQTRHCSSKSTSTIAPRRSSNS